MGTNSQTEEKDLVPSCKKNDMPLMTPEGGEFLGPIGKGPSDQGKIRKKKKKAGRCKEDKEGKESNKLGEKKEPERGGEKNCFSAKGRD